MLPLFSPLAAASAPAHFDAVLCAIGRNEPPAELDDWIAFHNAQLIHVVLYDHHSDRPIDIDQGHSVEVVQTWPTPQLLADRCGHATASVARQRACKSLEVCMRIMKRSLAESHIQCQIAAYDDCFARYSHRTRWMGTWDPDEYVFPCGHAEAVRVPKGLSSIVSLAEEYNASAIEFLPLRFGMRSIVASGRVRSHLWRAPYAHRGETVRCPVEEFEANWTTLGVNPIHPSRFCENEGAQKWLSRVEFLDRNSSHPLHIHTHAHKKNHLARNKIQWAQSWMRGFCCNHYAYTSLEQVQRKSNYYQGQNFRMQLVRTNIFNTSWFSVYDDSLVQYEEDTVGIRTAHRMAHSMVRHHVE